MNVFLGIGLPWSVAAIYWVAQGYDGLQVKAGTLTFAVILFCIEAFIGEFEEFLSTIISDYLMTRIYGNL